MKETREYFWIIFGLFYLSTWNLQMNQLFNKPVLKADERGRLNGFVVGI